MDVLNSMAIVSQALGVIWNLPQILTNQFSLFFPTTPLLNTLGHTRFAKVATSLILLSTVWNMTMLLNWNPWLTLHLNIRVTKYSVILFDSSSNQEIPCPMTKLFRIAFMSTCTAATMTALNTLLTWKKYTYNNHPIITAAHQKRTMGTTTRIQQCKHHWSAWRRLFCSHWRQVLSTMDVIMKLIHNYLSQAFRSVFAIQPNHRYQMYYYIAHKGRLLLDSDSIVGYHLRDLKILS